MENFSAREIHTSKALAYGGSSGTSDNRRSRKQKESGAEEEECGCYTGRQVRETKVGTAEGRRRITVPGTVIK